MLYTEATKKAMKICFAAHADQVDEKALARASKYQAAIALLSEE